ncbi:MAG: endonuclease/exonuclease/phosphatase family protein [Pseudomonadota bacterium]|nr:endonuclease/exonuclease/phosphatase family protein [Pseudomonadota bacterium]
MTYNVKSHKALHRADGVAAIAREVATQDPDILVMQDADGLLPGAMTGIDHDAAVFGYREVYAAGQYVVASRFPLSDCVHKTLGPSGDDALFVTCVVEVRGTRLSLVTAHFESPREGLNATRHEGLEGFATWRRNYANRLAQSKVLASALAAVQRPLIVAGDLNAPETSWVVSRLLAAGLRDAFPAAGRGYGYTYGHALRTGFSFLRIDHILVSPGVELTDCTVGTEDASDHRPVIADIALTPLR